MPISLFRIDERLIHGQIAYSWSTAYPSDQFMVIDNELAVDEFQKGLLEMAVPSGKSFQVLDTQAAIEYLKQPDFPRTLIVVKGPETIVDLINGGVKLQSINVGGMYFRSDRKEYTKTVYLNETEVDWLKQIAAAGVALDLRTTPGDRSIDLAKKL